MSANFTWCQTVLDFCVKHGFEAGKLQVKGGSPYVEVICSENLPNKEALTKELKDLLPEGSDVIYTVTIRRSTVDNLKAELNSTNLPWALDVKDHVVKIKAVIPKAHPVWDKIMEHTRKDSYIKEVQVRVLDQDTMREAVANGSSPQEAERIAEENAEEILQVNLPVSLVEEIARNNETGHRISSDDLLNLRITLNTCNTVEEFLKVI